MKIFLDTKDLINLFQKSPRTSVDDFISKLWDGDHKLVFSVLTIMEYSNQKSGGGEDKEEQIKNIFQILEPAPKEYIEVPILKYEIKEAFNAFFDKRPYKGLSPFKDQFDKVLRNEKDWGRYNSCNLLETVLFLYNNYSGSISADPFTNGLQKIFESDRATLKDSQDQKETFRDNVFKLLEDAQLRIPYLCDFLNFSDWLYDDPSICPAFRLSLEVRYQMLKNTADIPKPGDLPDLGNIYCLPYVDLATLDKRIRDYVRRASRNLGQCYEDRLCTNWQEVFDKI